ncbi:hypothetical protein G7054_g12383 [Neopestalotiopsis clavispora]|nr:hypothetical protein G7054_g12383 [Neopestalotiopsis clavispora]
MCSTSREYYIAWILSSCDQYEAAHSQFGDTVGHHEVVIASPSSKTDSPSIEITVNNLLLEFPSIRAGFVVSTDAYVPRERVPRVGDVVFGGQLPDMDEGVVYVDFEKTNQKQRLIMTGQSGKIPAVISAAVKKLRSQDGFNSWLERVREDGRSPEELSAASSIHNVQKTAVYQRKPQVFYGVIASSAQQIESSVVEKSTGGEKGYLCFETAASTIKNRPLSLLAGITSYCGEEGDLSIRDLSARDRGCKAVVSYLARLTQQIDHHELELEPAIKDYFTYETLNLERPTFRLLQLEGGIGQLRCHIFQASLPSDKKTSDDRLHDETMLIPYEALSYCWGSTKLTNLIHVNDKILPVTSNLFQALGYLRLPDRHRILWIDAICIDQQSALERGHQVDIMGRLYSEADEVLIWLGDIGDNTGRLMSLLRAFEASVPREARRQWVPEDDRYRDLWNQVQESSPGMKKSLQSNLRRLMTSPWFNRVWIIQEVAKAKKASLGWTKGWIDARTFAVVPKLLEITPSIQCQAIIDIMPGASRMSSWFRRKPNLATLLWRFRDSRASDSRDKLYALLGISLRNPFIPDYGKTEQDLVKELMKYFLPRTSISVDSRDLRMDDIPTFFIKGLEQLILEGIDLYELERLTTRLTTPLLLSIETVDYLRYVGSPLLAQLLQHDPLVVLESPTVHELRGLTTLTSFLAEGVKVKVSPGIFNASLQNGMGFIPMVLELDRDDIEITHALAIEAISNGPSELERFLDKYGNQVGSTDDVGAQKILGLLEKLRGTFEHAGVFLRHSDMLRKGLYRRCNPDVRVAEPDMTEAELQSYDVQFQAFLQQMSDKITVTDEVNPKAIRGGQDMIKSFITKCGKDFDPSKELMKDLISTYSVEIFLSSRVDNVEVMQLTMWPGFNLGRHGLCSHAKTIQEYA